MNLTYLEIEHKRSDFDSLIGDPRRDFVDRLIMSWLYHDHALEGVVLEKDDILRALSGQPSRNWCDGQVHKSLCRMREVTLDIFARRIDLSDPADTLRTLHARLSEPADEQAGRYRKRDTSPGVYNLDVVPAASISYYFRKFLDMLETELSRVHPIRAASMAHWELMKVFPFDEKTGMVARLFLNATLVSMGYPPAIIHARDRHHYFGALDGHRTDLIPIVVDAMQGSITAASLYKKNFVEPSTDQLAL